MNDVIHGILCDIMMTDAVAAEEVLKAAAGGGMFARDVCLARLEACARRFSLSIVSDSPDVVVVAGELLAFEIEWDVPLGCYVLSKVRSHPPERVPAFCCIWHNTWVPPLVIFDGLPVAIAFDLSRPMSLRAVFARMIQYNRSFYEPHAEALLAFYFTMCAKCNIDIPPSV